MWRGVAMPIHDWNRVQAGIFHHFHHDWITEIARALNSGILPEDHYALAEQQAAGFGPDVLTLQGTGPKADGGSTEGPAPAGSGLLLAPPNVRFSAESPHELYRRKTSTLTV